MTTEAIQAALVAEQDRIMRVIGDYVDDDTSYVQAAYRVMATVAPDLTPQRWYELTGLQNGPCEDWRQCCGWCNGHGQHCGGEDAEKDDVCNMGHCHYCDHNCSDYD